MKRSNSIWPKSNEEYLHRSGQKPDLQLSEIYETYQHLLSKDLIHQLIETGKQQEDRRQLNYLISFLFRNYLGLFGKELNDQIATQEAQATIEVDGGVVNYRQAERSIVNTPEPAKRDEINRKRSEVLQQHNIMRKEIVEREHDMVRELGYDSYTVSGIGSMTYA